MNLLKVFRVSPVQNGFRCIRTNSSNANNDTFTKTTFLSECLKITQSEAEYMCLKYPTIFKLSKIDLQNIIKTIRELGYRKNILKEQPQIFSIHPITLKYRYKVLDECGIRDILPIHLVKYLPIVKLKTVKELKETKLIPNALNIENRLASYMTNWPTSLTTLINGDMNEKTLYYLRLKIVQRYLELVLELSEDEFQRGIRTYPTIKHRPLAVINESLTLLQSIAMIPVNKIKNNLYLVHADPENIQNIVFKFRSIGGIDIKEILRLHPKIAMKNYHTLLEIRKVLQEFDISNEAQVRCFEIYTLSPETIKDRLIKAREIPEFQVLYNHPRFLKMIYYNNTAMKRLRMLYTSNKKCLSLNILSGCSKHYKLFEKAPGDRSGKGKDLVFFLSQAFGEKYSSSDIRKLIRRHQFWINIPVVQVKLVHQKLSLQFSSKEIYENCPILLYPWPKIKKTLTEVTANKTKTSNSAIEQIDYQNLSKSQTLSMVLYLLEKKHYFTGNGVWTEEQIKNVVDNS